MTVSLSFRWQAVLALSSLLLSGCAIQSTVPPIAQSGASIQGRVHGGQQPVVGSHIYLFAAGTSGYGGASTSLLTTNTAGTDLLGSYVLTDSSGSFSITGDYTCTTGTEIYILATQGNPGLPVINGNSPPNNPSLALMATLGVCPASGSLASAFPFVWINEVTTVASVYALAGFMTDLSHVSSSGTALAQIGIQNAFDTSAGLVNIASGTPTPGAASFLYGVADILAACVNSDGTVTGPTNPTNCYTLFTNAMNGTTQPTDAVTAALNIAHNPATNVANLNNLQPGVGAPFPTYQPNSFFLELSYALPILPSPQTLGVPTTLAISSAGTVAIGATIPDPDHVGGIYTFSPLGVYEGATFTDTQNVSSIAMDLSGIAWVVRGGYPTKIAPPFSYSGIDYSGVLALDSSGNVWFPNCCSDPNGLVELNGSTGALISSANGYGGGGVSSPMSLAVDGTGHVWAANSDNSLSEFNVADGSPVSNSSFTGGGLNGPGPMAIDHVGNVWITNTPFGSLSEFNGTTGAPISPSAGYTAGGLSNSRPTGIAIDGLSNVWVIGSTNSAGTISELSSAGQAISPAGGYVFDTNLGGYTAIAVDGSGNVWFTTSGGYLNKLVGAAAPVVTPLLAGVANNTLGTEP